MQALPKWNAAQSPNLQHLGKRYLRGIDYNRLCSHRKYFQGWWSVTGSVTSQPERKNKTIDKNCKHFTSYNITNFPNWSCMWSQLMFDSYVLWHVIFKCPDVILSNSVCIIFASIPRTEIWILKKAGFSILVSFCWMSLKLMYISESYKKKAFLREQNKASDPHTWELQQLETTLRRILDYPFRKNPRGVFSYQSWLLSVTSCFLVVLNFSSLFVLCFQEKWIIDYINCTFYMAKTFTTKKGHEKAYVCLCDCREDFITWKTIF